MAKMVEMNARGIIELNKYGLVVDGNSLLEELVKHFGEYGEFAGSIHILITDETEPLEVMSSYHMGEIPESVKNAIREIVLGVRLEKDVDSDEPADDNE